VSILARNIIMLARRAGHKLSFAGVTFGLQYICRLAWASALLYLRYANKEGAPHVDLALNLNVLAVFAVFTFVGALLLGAF
jgi:hypothetical protein